MSVRVRVPATSANLGPGFDALGVALAWTADLTFELREPGPPSEDGAIAAIEGMADRYTAAGKRLVLRHLSPDCHALLRRAGQLVVESDDDPNYGVAVDYDVQPGALGGGH